MDSKYVDRGDGIDPRASGEGFIGNKNSPCTKAKV